MTDTEQEPDRQRALDPKHDALSDGQATAQLSLATWAKIRLEFDSLPPHVLNYKEVPRYAPNAMSHSVY